MQTQPTRLPNWEACLYSFAASCTTLVLELIAGRLLSPFVGSSLYTWTSIIGVVLLGISVGNWVGGKMADSRASTRLVAGLFLGGAAFSLLTLGFVSALGDGSALRWIPLLPRIFALTAVAFFPPSFLLGAITPVVIRLALGDTLTTGRVVGMIFAVGTLGSLVGNFLTGFVLVAYLRVDAILIGVVVVCVLLATYGLARGRLVEPVGALTGSIGAVTGLVHAKPRGPMSLSGNLFLACAVVFAASFCSMTVELAASRVMAPWVGSSLYSWTGIIGVVLAGITIGNYLGGRVADRTARQWVLGVTVFLGGLACLSVLVMVQIAPVAPAITQLELMPRIVAMTAALFFVPVLFLGAISPQVIALAVTEVATAGTVAGRVYAWSTAGAIIGTFATGWALISLLGVYTLVFAVGVVLLILGILVGRFWRKAIPLTAALAVACGSGYALLERDALRSECTVETNYFCIRIRDANLNGLAVKGLVLDHLIHSYVKLGDPSYLGYEHEQVQAELAHWVADRHSNPHILVIGGGGYTYPRWVEAFVPTATIEVVEIDPGVTEVDHAFLGLPRDTRIVTYNLDGRQFVQEMAPRGHYHLVVQDAVNDLSVPFHIMTKEYNDRVRGLLAPDGVFLLTVIDLNDDGQLMRSAARTMAQTFPHVQLLAASPIWTYSGSSVWVIAGSTEPINLTEVQDALNRRGAGRMRTIAQPEEQLVAYTAQGPQIILTDQYAPVDNLISILFAKRN